jgi:serine/threonine protein phosphatase PrpC
VLHEGFCTDTKDKQKGLEAALLDVFHSLDDEVCDFLYKEDDSSGSTAVVAVYDGRRHILTVASTGDSMCVLSRGGRAVKHNRMHRFNEEDECKRVKASGGSIVNNRLNGLLAVSRSFGDIPFKEKGISRSKMALIATPEVISEVITPMTEFAIIATDGLWDVFTSQEAVDYVQNILINISENNNDIEDDEDDEKRIIIGNNNNNKMSIDAQIAAIKRNMAKMLANEALKRDASDNITIIIQWLN